MSAATLVFGHADEATNWAIDWLQARGYAVTAREREEWLTPKELRGRHPDGLGASGLCKRLADPRCPAFRARRGPTGRLILIAATPALLAWVTRPCMPGERSDR